VELPGAKGNSETRGKRIRITSTEYRLGGLDKEDYPHMCIGQCTHFCK